MKHFGTKRILLGKEHSNDFFVRQLCEENEQYSIMVLIKMILKNSIIENVGKNMQQ